MITKYKSTIFLPKTNFPMRGELPKLEPKILAWWKQIKLDQRILKIHKNSEPFILHDGPPYANGDLHMGHALNKILKDLANRTQHMNGKRIHYVPGWDCHGMPIEWKIEKKYRARGIDKDTVPIINFRQKCREFASKLINIQREKFQRLGITGDWDNYYTTMDFKAEAQIAREIGKLLMNGSLYKGEKPVMWSVVEKTALAESEVEYQDHTSITAHFCFSVIKTNNRKLANTKIVIWTTNPWTIHGNRAIAYGNTIDYVVVMPIAVAKNSLAKIGEKLVVARSLLDKFKNQAKIEATNELAVLKGSDIEGTICAHPLSGCGYEYEVPLIAADFATEDAGTGFVHIAPAHGVDDFILCTENGLEVPQTIANDGVFYDHVPIFAGMNILKDNLKILSIMRDYGGIIAISEIQHPYPYSWRSKTPLIFRNTVQWFISMETNALRNTALKEIDNTLFVPNSSHKRLRKMVENRPDWCISRQRTWGVPIPVFTSKKTGEPLRDQAVIDRITNTFETEGADIWFTKDCFKLLEPEYDPNDYEQVTDVADVWLDSGSTHAFVLESNEPAWADLSSPAHLYLEGSDQHRGWFHSSLLIGCSTRGHAPYKAILTHGFLNDEHGRKMSKSLNNGIDPLQVISKSGADVLRIWVVSCDFTDDLRIGPSILKHSVDHYRRLRNTLRYLLGALNDYSDAEAIEPNDMPELERWVLHRIYEIDLIIRQCTKDFNYHKMFLTIQHFCSVDLSAFYFDVRKDSLYCDTKRSKRRRAMRTIMNILFECLTKWLAPICVFTAEEAWRSRNSGEYDSIHLQEYPIVPVEWQNETLAKKWLKIRAVRRVVTGALELERAEKRIKSSLQAAPIVYMPSSDKAAFDGLSAAEIFITSDVTLSDSLGPITAYRLPEIPDITCEASLLAKGKKCERCWRILPEVVGDEPICVRCQDAIYDLVNTTE
ncbi:isoleucyl-tRNA synthetase [Candidatus Endolissoclinum faulkneri L2]|uniref:Isoleucine--tRNA ligase n=1 Tax=Candidatus Endolissoclinum faulkneri L2 TaxID=1193729 RepID=K7YJ52_9PROT|nr:isoleucine--tRNA ligase [Candidatus Endolissoclinum faulkneri]AFX99675.1 isoleucyl-tRNA synthetase [Candidatus Endolissoclinum faulkneri L2]